MLKRDRPFQRVIISFGSTTGVLDRNELQIEIRNQAFCTLQGQ